MEQCENCGRSIGKLETPRLWSERVVCTECHEILSGGTHTPAAPPPIQKSETATSYRCLSCGSHDTSSIRVVHESGTSNISIVGITGGGDLGLAGGTSQSQMSQRASPPAKKSELAFYISLVFFLFTLFTIIAQFTIDGYRRDATDDRIKAAFFMVVFAGMGVICLAANIPVSRYNRNVWPKEYAAWAQRWVCRRCGTIFTPQRATSQI